MGAVQKALRGLQHFAAHLIIERPARRIGMDGLLGGLERSGSHLDKRLTALTGHPRNQKNLAHIISIERWGQHRLRYALGEPIHQDESDHYRPPDGLDWAELQSAFREARQSTIGLGRTLRMAGVDPLISIEHNQLGKLSILAWIYYLEMHARFESLWFN